MGWGERLACPTRGPAGVGVDPNAAWAGVKDRFVQPEDQRGTGVDPNAAF